MSQRGPRGNDFEDRDYYPAPARSTRFAEAEFRPRVATRERDDVDIRITEREGDRTPAFLREDARRTEAGPMVLRQRDVETYDRHRPRSVSPVARVREERLVRRPRSPSPVRVEDREYEHEHTRVIERDRVRSPSRERRRSPPPRPVRYVERVERRERSPSPHSRERIRIIEREREKERVPSPSPSPSPPPAVVRGPTIEREVITHYRDIDHGTVQVRRPTPPPAPRPRQREERETRETDIDITLSKNRTDVDIHRSTSRVRAGSRERRTRFHDDDLVVRRDSDRLRVDEHSGSRRRSHSAAPLGSPVDEEADYITSKIDSRGRMGEAFNGATKKWEIVDVPPGTERVRMDGVGGGSTDTTWSRYSGVRRTKFIPERDGVVVPVPREKTPPPRRERERGGEWDHELEIDIDRRITRTPQPPPPPPPRDMWTEITKDLVIREAIEQMGYGYEETRDFFYIMDYLPYDAVLRLTELSEDIRRSRKDRVREIEYERDYYHDGRDRRRHHHHHHQPWPPQRWDDERISETEVIYDSRGPARKYYR